MKEFKTKFISLLKEAKQMKKAIVTFQGGFLLGTDETFSSLDVLYYNEEVYDLFELPQYKGLRVTFVINELIAFLKEYDILEEQFIIDKYGICSKLNKQIYLMSNIIYQSRIDSIFGNYMMYKTIGFHTIESFDIRKDEEFNSLLSMKKNSGSVMYYLQGRYPMSTFSTIHPVTKSDKMTVDIYEIPNNNAFLALFTIYKKTSKIEEYIAYREIF